MIYSRDPRFIFVHIPKTAGTSIEEAIYQYQDFLVTNQNIHQPMIQFREYLNHDEYDEAFKFCFVRNPFDLMYSTWKYWTHDNNLNVSFEDWIIWRFEGRMSDGLKFLEGESYRFSDEASMLSQLTISWYMNRVPQTYWFVDEDGQFLCDYIGSFEYLREDFKEVVNHLKLEDVFLPHANKGRADDDRDYRKYYTDRTRKIIEKRFALDLAIFGYSFDELKPSHDRFGFVKPERDSLEKFGEDIPKKYVFNHATLPYGFSQNLKRHGVGENFEEQIKEFELDKLRMRVRSLNSNLQKISENIRQYEGELFEMEDGDDFLEKEQQILSERQLELLFKLKLNKLKNEINSRG